MRVTWFERTKLDPEKRAAMERAAVAFWHRVAKFAADDSKYIKVLKEPYLPKHNGEYVRAVVEVNGTRYGWRTYLPIFPNEVPTWETADNLDKARDVERFYRSVEKTILTHLAAHGPVFPDNYELGYRQLMTLAEQLHLQHFAHMFPAASRYRQITFIFKWLCTQVDYKEHTYIKEGVWQFLNMTPPAIEALMTKQDEHEFAFLAANDLLEVYPESTIQQLTKYVEQWIEWRKELTYVVQET